MVFIVAGPSGVAREQIIYGGVSMKSLEEFETVKKVWGTDDGPEWCEFKTGNISCGGRYLVSRKTRSRNWEVWDFSGEELVLVCLAVYKKGALEVMRRLAVADEKINGGV